MRRGRDVDRRHLTHFHDNRRFPLIATIMSIDRHADTISIAVACLHVADRRRRQARKRMESSEEQEDEEEEFLSEGFAFGGEPSVRQEENDLYSVLNVARNASDEELRSAYKRLCVLFHPDKHANDRFKLLSRQLFLRVGHAYKVLSDRRTRAVYDVYGEKGLQGFQRDSQPFQTAAEMVEMHRRLQRVKAYSELLRMASPMCSVSFSPWGSKKSSHVIHLAQSIQLPLTPADILSYGLTMDVVSPKKAHGQVNVSWLHTFSHTSRLRADIGVGTMQSFGLDCQLGLPCSSYIQFLALGQCVHRKKKLTMSMSPQLTFGRNLQKNSSVELALSSSGLSMSFRHGNFQCGWKLKHIHSFADATYKSEPLPKVRCHAYARAQATGIRVTYGLERSITQWTKLGLEIRLRSPGGIALCLR